MTARVRLDAHKYLDYSLGKGAALKLTLLLVRNQESGFSYLTLILHGKLSAHQERSRLMPPQNWHVSPSDSRVHGVFSLLSSLRYRIALILI